ncbi:MAG TPA: hypothetical protein VF491_03055 [Vicinamibacterales bacterium]|jgi:V/A-type H+-transporting ATPase subunit F
MRKIVVATPPDAEGGFAIAGVVHPPRSAEGWMKTIDDGLAGSDIGVLAVDERLLDGSALERIRRLDRQWRGVLVVLPAPTAPVSPEDDFARRLIRRAIGYQVRVQL